MLDTTEKHVETQKLLLFMVRKNIEIAQNMLKQGLDIEVIHGVTVLGKNKTEKLK
jgi:hypothetical protein